MLLPSLLPNIFTSSEPATVLYDELRAYGDMTIDEWTFQNNDVPDSTVWDYGTTSVPTWNVNTILLAHLDSNFDAGNFVSNNRPVTHWRILRKKYGTTDEYVEIGFIPNTNTNLFYDTKASANTSYSYGVQAVSNGIRGSVIFAEVINPPVPGGGVEVSFYGWKISSTDYNEQTNTGTLYSFVAANETDDIKTIFARTEYDSAYAKFPKIEVGTLKYRTGTITTMPFVCVSNQMEFGNNALRDEIITFLSNGQPKILKNGSGLTMVVDTYDPAVKYFDELSNSNATQPYTISFSFVEIADITDL